MTTDAFLKMLKVAGSTLPHGVTPRGDAFSRMLMDDASTENAAPWQKYISERKAELSKGLSPEAAAQRIKEDQTANPDRWSLDRMRKGVKDEASWWYSAVKPVIDRHTGFTANMGWNPATWIPTGRHLDMDWMDEQIGDGSHAIFDEKDPYERAKLHAKMAIADRIRRKGAAHIEKRTTAPMHVLKRMKEWSMVSPLADAATALDRWALDTPRVQESADQLANEYNQAVLEYTGDEQKARSAERWLRGAGWGAAVVNAGAEIAATHGLSAKAQAAMQGTRVLQAYNTIDKSTRGGKILVGTVNGLKNAWTAYQSGRVVRPTAQGYVDVLTNGGKEDHDGLTGASLRIAAFIDSYAASAPYWALGQGVAGGIISTVPYLGRVGEWMSKGTSPWVKEGEGILGNARNMLSYFAHNPGSTLKALMKQRINSLKTAPISTTMEITNARRENRPVDWKAILGFSNREIVNATTNTLDRNDTFAVSHHYNDAPDWLELQYKDIDANPESWRREFSMPGVSTTTLKAELNSRYAAYRTAYAEQQAMADAKEGEPSDAFAGRLFTNLKQEAMKGGPLPPEVFSDPRLTFDQRSDIFNMYVRSAYNHELGVMKGNPVMQLKHLKSDGDDNTIVVAMNSSPYVEDAAMSLIGGALSDGLQAGGLGSMDEEQQRYFNLMWGALTPEKRREAFRSALNNADARQVFGLMRGGGPGVSADVALPATQVLYERMEKDKPFRDDFVKEFASAAGAGTGMNLSPEMKTMFLDFADKADAGILFNDLPRDQYNALLRMMIANQASGGSMMADQDQEKVKRVTDKLTAAAEAEGKALMRQDPLRNVPMMASLWALKHGYSDASELLQNPAIFWGVSALLLLGGIWLGGNVLDSLAGEDDENEGKGGGNMMKELQRQRELLADATV